MALFLWIFLLLLTLGCVADTVSPGIKDLAERPKQISGSSVLPTIDSEAELLDIVLVASVDGKFRALNRTSGQTLWSMSSYAADGSSLASFAPLVRTVHPERDPDLTDDTIDQEIYIIEPQSGDIYVMADPSGPLQRFPFSMSELVEISPFSFSDSDDHRVFVGQKETSLLLIELETGRIKATLNSACPWDPFEDLQQSEDEVDLDELEGINHKAPPPTEVFIGRTDYHISIMRRPNPKSSSKVPVQNLSFSTYGPNNQDNLLQAAYSRTKDNCYIQSLPNGDIISIKADSLDQTGSKFEPLWIRQFDSAIVAVFDVLRKPSMRSSAPPHTFVLLQPRPGLQELGLLPTTDTLPPNSHSAYIGMVKETGSLFAMSPSRYPLVAFDDASRQSRPSMIDGPIGTPSELPANVDDVTRSRKERQRQQHELYATCDQSTPFHPRCLVGVHKLEEGQLTWLPEGVPANESYQPPSLNVTVPEERSWPSISKPGRISEWSFALRTIWEVIFTVTLLGGVSVWLAFGRSRRTNLNNVGDTNPLPVVSDSPTSFSNAEPTVSPSPEEMSEQHSFRPPALLLKQNHEDGEESDREAEEDAEPTPVSGRRKPRRGKRGTKKKRPLASDAKENQDDAVDNVENPPETSLITPAIKPTTTTSLVVSDVVLGFGSHGTVVYQGSLQGRAVAVKRLLQDFVTLASREVSILQESDDHPNVIRYYYQEAHANFLYIALELCPASLADIIESPDREQFRDIAIAFDPKKALREITSGLRHLHDLKLVHRDIKPQNILVSFPKASSRNGYRMLISDFGLCKKLDVDQTSFLPTAYGAMAAGTVGWRAPEILRGEVKLDEIGDDQSISSSRGSTGSGSNVSSIKPARLTKSIDIFALGCLFYYTLTNGSHPFGDRYEREVNILKNARSLEGLQRFGEEGSEAVDLIAQMLDPEANKRPETTTCLLHPFFWNSGRRLNFLQDASDRFEIMNREPRDPVLVLLEENAYSVVGNDWQTRVDKIFLDNLGKFRKYDGRSVQDLLRALRNKKHHYQDLPENVKRHLGAMPEGYLAYFTRRYPGLFLHVHSVISNTALRTESMFKSYYEIGD